MRKTEKKVEFVKKKAIMLLLAAAVIGSLCACGAGSETAPPAETAATVEPATETTVEAAPDETAETEPTVVEGDLFLKASSVTFSLVGEQEDIYLGVIPRELVSWESDDPSVVSVENGVLTATGVGTTTVRASYADRSVSWHGRLPGRDRGSFAAIGYGHPLRAEAFAAGGGSGRALHLF